MQQKALFRCNPGAGHISKERQYKSRRGVKEKSVDLGPLPLPLIAKNGKHDIDYGIAVDMRGDLRAIKKWS